VQAAARAGNLELGAARVVRPDGLGTEIERTRWSTDNLRLGERERKYASQFTPSSK